MSSSHDQRLVVVIFRLCAGTGLQAPAGNGNYWPGPPWLAEHCGRRPAGQSSGSAQLRAQACGPRTGPLAQACGPRTWHQVQHLTFGSSCMSAGRVNLRVQHLRAQAGAENLRVQHLRAQAGGRRTFGLSTFGRKPAGREPSGSAPSGESRRAENLRVQHLRAQAGGPRTFKHLRAQARGPRTFGFSAEPGAGLRAENRAQACGPRTVGLSTTSSQVVNLS